MRKAIILDINIFVKRLNRNIKIFMNKLQLKISYETVPSMNSSFDTLWLQQITPHHQRINKTKKHQQF